MDSKPPFSGTVKEYSIESFVCGEDGEESLDYRITTRYNENHKVSEVQNFDSNDELSEVSRYFYDESQNLVEIGVKMADESEKHFVHEYKDSKLSQITEIASGYKVVTKFDDLGNLIEKQNLGDEDSPFSTTKYINLYDQDGRLVERHTIFPSGDSDYIDKYQYNDAGQLIEEQRIRHGMISLARHSYNDAGDLILSEFNPGESNNETLKKEIVYAENGDILEINEYRKGWCYQNHNDEFGLTGITRFSYLR